MKKYIKSSIENSMLAVFWYNGVEFFGSEDYIGGDSAIEYGDYIQLNDDHIELWDMYKVLLNDNHEYDYYPRGRILFKIPIHKFIVICDEKIANNDVIRNKLLDYYNLPKSTIFTTDEHYQSEFEV